VGVQQTVVCPTHGTADTADLVFFTDVDEALLPNVGFRRIPVVPLTANN